MRNIRIGLGVMLLYLNEAGSVELFERNGEVFYRADGGATRQISTGKHNVGAVLSRDGKFAAFVHDASADHATGESELWLADISAKTARCILHSKTHNDPKKNLTHLNNPVFSLDGKSIYFLSSAWATSDAIHRIEIATQQQRYVTDGNSLSVIAQGKYAGHLVVSKHEYVPGGSSVENFCQVSPAGRKIKCFGSSEQNWRRVVSGQ